MNGLVMYNCRRCKTATRIEYGEREVERRWRDSFGRDRTTYRRFRIDVDNGRRLFPGCEQDAVCPTCKRRREWGFIDGNVVESVPCSGICTNARGFKCDCSCGGENHGKGWAGPLGRPLKEVLA